MSIYTNRAMLSLHNMIREMYRKRIELGRVTKCSVQLILSGASVNSIPDKIIKDLVDSQNKDGGFVANTDTIWNAKLLSYFPEYKNQYESAMNWLNANRTQLGFGRGCRDMGRIPVTGIAFYLHPCLCTQQSLLWLESLWESEKDSLTYKAAYTLMAFKKNGYIPKNKDLIEETGIWLMSQQENDGGFAPWKNHPVKSNIYCTAVSVIGLMSYFRDNEDYKNCILTAYEYMVKTQLKNGIWPYHELEDGGAWGLRAMSMIEEEYLLQ